jgi:ABC-2 type transport system ATP-binding protein
MDYVLQTNGLTKIFGKKVAVKGINMNVKKGDIYGFIGRNGAGKTTFIRMISGLAHSSGGAIRLFESDEVDKQRYRLGTMIENPAVFPNMTARDNLKYYCKLLAVSTDKIDEMLALVGLSDTGKKKAKNFSLGMKQRLAIAIALMGEPEFLLLDEPINGLDPSGIKEIRELILKLNKEKNITILVSSHILGELSKIATRYGVINNGVLVDEFTNEELLLRCSGKLEYKISDAEQAAAILAKHIDPSDISIIDDKTIHISKDLDKAGVLTSELAKNGIMINSCSVIGQDLEAYFMYLCDITDKNIS